MRFWPLFLRLCSAVLWLPGVLLLLLSIPIRRWGGWTAMCCSLLSRAGPGSLVAPDQAPRAAARLARSGFARRPEAGFRREAFAELPPCTAVLRSEEHTSELQSLMRISYDVFCLTKKKRRQPH